MGLRRVFERGCVEGGFPFQRACWYFFSYPQEDFQRVPSLGREDPAREQVGPRKLMWCGGKRWCMERLSLILTDQRGRTVKVEKLKMAHVQS